MSEPAIVTKISKQNVPQIGVAYLDGRISNRRKHSGKDGVFWFTVIKLPAKDKFSHPATVEVMSHRPIGEIGDDWSGNVEITGYPRSYDSKPDFETGEIRRIVTADTRLRVIEE